jgi:hypothetical protein
MASIINADNGVSSGSAGLKYSADSSGVLELQTSGTATLSIDTSGNINIPGTGKRILGDFSNATIANRVMVQTSTTNGATRVNAIPNGTSQISDLTLWNNSDPTNAANSRMYVSASEMGVVSQVSGTGTYLPMVFGTGGSERLRIDTSGNVGIGTSSPFSAAGYGALTINGSSGGISSYYTGGSETGRIQSFSDGTNIGVLQLESMGSLSQMRFRTNGSERMRIDSSGNVGIGVTPSINSLSGSGYKYLEVGGVGTGLYCGAGETYLTNNWYFDSTFKYAANGFATSYQQVRSVGEHRWFIAPSGTAGNSATFTQAMTLNSSGNLLLGTTSGSSRLNISGNVEILGYTGGSYQLGCYSPSGANRNIFSAGVLGVSNGFAVLYVSGAMQYVMTGLASGTVSSSSGVLSASSDRNMKIADGEVESALDKVNALKPRYFYWKDTDGNANLEQGRQLGFYAQEVHSVIPEASPEPVKEHDGWGIYDRALVATLTAAIQEQQAMINDLKAEVAALKAQG